MTGPANINAARHVSRLCPLLPPPAKHLGTRHAHRMLCCCQTYRRCEPSLWSIDFTGASGHAARQVQPTVLQSVPEAAVAALFALATYGISEQFCSSWASHSLYASAGHSCQATGSTHNVAKQQHHHNDLELGFKMLKTPTRARFGP